MDDVKPRFFVSHDAGGLFLWQSRARPTMNPKTGLYECKDGTGMRLPYSWFGYMMRENSIRKIDLEALVMATVDGIPL
jgi:hypothetical protein